MAPVRRSLWGSTGRQQSGAAALPFWSALGLAGAFFAFVAWDQSHWWRLKEDYTFGWLAPLFAGFVVYDRRARIAAALRACAEPGSPRAQGTAKSLLRFAAGVSLLGGALLFLAGACYRAGIGTSQPGTLAITVGAIGLTLPLILLTAPAGAPSDGDPADTGVSGGCAPVLGDVRLRLLLLFVFPAGVWLLSAPIVSALESPLSLFLLRRVVSVLSWMFDVLGLPVEQRGNVLLLPTGSVGVEDACSGIRSLTGCLFTGSFLAAVFLNRVWKKVALVGAALVLAFVTNLARGLFLALWAYHQGPEAIDGVVHDLAGYGVLGMTVVGLLCLLPLFNGREASDVSSGRLVRSPATRRR